MGWWKDVRGALGLGGRGGAERDGTDAVAAVLRACVGDSDETLAIRLGAAPPPGPDRHEWMRRQVERALSCPATAEGYDLTGALGRAIAKRLSDPAVIRHMLEQPSLTDACERVAGGMAIRFEAMSATGMELIRRISEESGSLASQSDEQIHRRFSGIPPARADELPGEGPGRTAWIRETLIGENACVRTGAVSPDLAVAAAQRIGVEIARPERRDGPARIESAAYHPDLAPWRRIAEQADHLATQGDASLRIRFSRLPRIQGIVIPDQPAPRTAWIKRALAAEHVRRIAGMTQEASPEAEGPAMQIELLGMQVATSSGGLAFEGSLFVDGTRICDLSSPGGGVIEAAQWARGCSQADLDAISAYVSAVGDEREGGRPDTLTDRMLDQVSMHQALAAYREACAAAVLFIEEGSGAPLVLLRVPVPIGGDRAAASAHIRAQHPGAVILDELEEEDAALVWLATG